MRSLVFVAPIAALRIAGRPQRLRWLLIGIVVGVAIWLAPLLQNLDPQGNLTATLKGNSGQTEGIAFGLRAVAAAGSPWPVWLKHEPSGYFGTLAFLYANRPLAGLLVLALLAVIAVASSRGGHRSLTSLALVALMCSIGFTGGLAIFPTKNGLSLDYLIYGLWVVGVLLWTVVGWSVALVIPLVVRRISSSTMVAPRRGYPWMNTFGAIGVAALLAVGFACALAISVRQGQHHEPLRRGTLTRRSERHHGQSKGGFRPGRWSLPSTRRRGDLSG